jgi:hypothetical protein
VRRKLAVGAVSVLMVCLGAGALASLREAPEGSHPLTAEHAARYRDVDLLWAAEQAIDEGRFEAARATLARHAREFGGARAEEDRAALALLARCVEQGSAAARAEARVFYETHRASPLRRRLRMLCFGAPAKAPAS